CFINLAVPVLVQPPHEFLGGGRPFRILRGGPLRMALEGGLTGGLALRFIENAITVLVELPDQLDAVRLRAAFRSRRSGGVLGDGGNGQGQDGGKRQQRFEKFHLASGDHSRSYRVLLNGWNIR